MGAVYGKHSTNSEEGSVEGLTEVDGSNGLVLGHQFMPPEVLAHILSYIDPVVVIKLRLVCKVWKDIVENDIWREKVLREVPGADSRIFNIPGVDWKDFCILCRKKPFLRNLLRNGSGKEKLKHWMVSSQRSGGSKWLVEEEPIGCYPFPKGETHCFTSSYSWCSADQIIDLLDCGLTPQLINGLKPNIHIEEWYAGRFDCGFEYNLKVSLLGHHHNVCDSFVFETTEHTVEWKKVENVFTNYKNGVVRICFHHRGKDTQFWAGHYGAKMTGAKVSLTLPGMPIET